MSPMSPCPHIPLSPVFPQFARLGAHGPLFWCPLIATPGVPRSLAVAEDIPLTVSPPTGGAGDPRSQRVGACSADGDGAGSPGGAGTTGGGVGGGRGAAGGTPPRGAAPRQPSAGLGTTGSTGGGGQRERDSRSYGWGGQGVVGCGMGTLRVGDTEGGGGDTGAATRDHKSCAVGTWMPSRARCGTAAVRHTTATAWTAVPLSATRAGGGTQNWE